MLEHRTITISLDPETREALTWLREDHGGNVSATIRSAVLAAHSGASSQVSDPGERWYRASEAGHAAVVRRATDTSTAPDDVIRAALRYAFQHVGEW